MPRYSRKAHPKAWLNWLPHQVATLSSVAGKMTMSRVLAVLNFVFGGLFGSLALVTLSYLPAEYGRRVAEPEDFYGLLFYSAVLTIVAAASLAVGWVLLKRGAGRRLSLGKASVLSLVNIVILLLFSLIAFVSDDPKDNLFRVLLLPAALSGASFVLLMRLRREKASERRRSGDSAFIFRGPSS